MEFTEKPQITSSQWMLTFADLLSLILTFFVMIYSMASPMQLANPFKKDFDNPITKEEDLNLSQIKPEIVPLSLTSDYLKQVFDTRISQNNELSFIGTRAENDKFIISIPQSRIDNNNIFAISELIRIYDNEKRVFAPKMSISKDIAEKLKNNGIAGKIGFYESGDVQDRIDIVIYF